MSLPANNTPWPPPQWVPVFDMAAEAAAWWEGDPKHLDAQYTRRPVMKPAQFNGGVVGAAARFFWGKPATGGDSQKKLHLPLAADIATTAAGLLFDTPPTVRSTDEAVQERLDALVNTEGFAEQLLVAGESASALGGVYWRVKWDTTISPEPWVEWVDADSAIPEWTHGKLTAVTVVDELPKVEEKITHRLLTRYTAGVVEFQLMAGRDNNLGDTVPLTEHPTTAPLAEIVDGNAYATGAPLMFAGYIPNARPVVGFRRSGQLRNMGRPDLSPDIYDLLDALDETWTKLMREVRLGQMRITLPSYMLRDAGPGRGAFMDVDQEIYDGLQARPDDGMKPEFHQPQLRVEEHLRVCDAIVREVIRRINLSPISFGLDTLGTGTMTAREITSKWQASLQTWKSKTRYWRAGLNAVAAALLHADGIMQGRPHHELPPLTVEFTPPVQETALDRAQTVQALESARAISTSEKVRMVHPEWTQDAINTEVAEILREQSGTYDPLLGATPDMLIPDPSDEE